MKTFIFLILVMSSHLSHGARQLRFSAIATLQSSTSSNASCRLSIENISSIQQTISLRSMGMYGTESSSATRNLSFKQDYNSYLCKSPGCAFTENTETEGTSTSADEITLAAGETVYLSSERLGVSFDYLTCKGIITVKEDKGALTGSGSARMVEGPTFRDFSFLLNGGRPF